VRKSLSFLLVLLLAVTLSAQVRTGNIYGRVVDTEGNPLPGVTVTLTGSKTAPMTAITSAEGNFRFISLPPANDYALKAELEGFKTVIRENIIVVVGGNVNITLTMEMGALEEEVTVVAETPQPLATPGLFCRWLPRLSLTVRMLVEPSQASSLVT